MMRRLVTEKKKTKLLKRKLLKRKAENKLLQNRLNKHSMVDGSSTSGSDAFGMEQSDGLSSTRNAVGTIQDVNQEEQQKGNTQNDEIQDEGHDPSHGNPQDENDNACNQDESRFLGSDDESRITMVRNATKERQTGYQTSFIRNVTTQEESRFLSSMNQLSVASINVPECKPTDDGDIHRQSFELWKDLLVDSMSLAGIEDEHTRFTVFKVKAGTKLLEIFRNTKSQNDDPDPITKPFANAMQRLKSYFGSGSDIMLMRRKLAMMAQQVDETNLAFVTRVGSTARLCGFDNGKEFEETVATIAEHARDKEIRTTALKMLSKKNGCFTDLIDKVREIESIKLNEEYVMRKQGMASQVQGQVSVAAVSAPFRRQQRFSGRYQTRNRPYQRPAQMSRTGWRPPRDGQINNNAAIQTQVKCYRCDSVFHSPDECSAKWKFCDSCGTKGHIRRACQRYREQRVLKVHEEQPQRIAIVEKTKEDPTEVENVSEIDS